jgi:hypothetical protein
MRLVVRPGIYDGDHAGANDIAVGAFEGERAWIIRNNAPEPRRNGIGHTVFAVEIA